MTDLAAGDLVRAAAPTAWVLDDTVIANITNTSYEAGSPELGVYFVAPPSGRVRLTIGGGFRDNGGSNVDRVFLAPNLFQDNSDGTEILAPSVTIRGYLAAREDTEFQYGSRISFIEDLVAGQLYYLRTMHLTNGGTDPDSADIAARDIIVIPLP